MSNAENDHRYDEAYYENNGQSGDRPALWMYERIWKRYCGSGPVLEFGGGVGSFAKRLTRHADVFAVESNEFARAKISRVAPTATPVADLADLEDQSCGSVVALHVLEHIDDENLTAILHQFKRIATRDARFLFVMPDFEGDAHLAKADNWSAFTDPTHINLKSNLAWEAFFEAQGLRSVHVFADGFYDFPYGRTMISRLTADPFRLAGTALQFALARPILSRGWGENVVFILERCE